jgi:hypothetical protein
MELAAGWKIAIATLLFVTLIVSGIHYDSASDAYYPYPDNHELKNAPASHVGSDVFVFGVVEQRNVAGSTADIRVDSSAGEFTIQVTDFAPEGSVESGGIVQVYGTFQGEYRIDAQNVRVINPNGNSNLYKYAVSVLGAGLILVLFFRYWRVDIRKLAIEAR